MTQETVDKSLLRFNGTMFTGGFRLNLDQELHVTVTDAAGVQVAEGFAQVVAITYKTRDDKLDRIHTAKLS